MDDYILCGGCSFTNDNFKSIIHPDMDTSWPKWPEVVGKYYNTRFVNIGVDGSSNDFMFDKFIDYILIRKYKPKHILFAMTEFNRFYFQWPSSVTRTFGVFENYDVSRNKDNYKLKKYILELALQNYIDTDLIINYNLKLLIRLIDTCELLNIPITIGLAFRPVGNGIIMKYKSDNGEYKNETFTAIEFQEYMLRTRNVKLKDSKLLDYDYFTKMFFKNKYFKKIEENPKYHSKIIGWPFINHIGGHSLNDWPRSHRYEYEISLEDFHPNAKGQEWMAKYFIKHIGPTL